MNKKICLLISSGFGIGYSPYFPGTLASFCSLFPLWFIKEKNDINILILLIFFFSIISIYVISITIKELKNKDPNFIVIDEFIGQSCALLICRQEIFDYLVAFLGFRLLDITKPFPINKLDNIKNAYGVLLDDILAGMIISILFYFYYETFI